MTPEERNATLLARVFRNDTILIRGTMHSAPQMGRAIMLDSLQPSAGELSYDGTFGSVTVERRATELIATRNSSERRDTAGKLLSKLLHERVYFFGAQRTVAGKGPFSYETRLNPDGSNLPQVLLALQGNRDRYCRLMNLLARVFPDVTWVSTHTTESGLEVRVWSVDPASERDDLAIPLEESGTGIGQALAILYVILTLPRSVIAIDEPTSFLHPSAARALMTTIAEFRERHQFHISTHSPEAISILRPDALFLLRKEQQRTTTDNIGTGELLSVRSVFAEIGARLSDLFASDSILWVEGATEELCFPMLIGSERASVLERCAIHALYNTGDLETRHRVAGATIWEVYRRLSAPNRLMPRTVAFSLDREGRTPTQRRDLERRSEGLIKFLPRRVYENYLIHPDAIAAVLGCLPTFVATPVSSAHVTQWIVANGGKPVYIPRRFQSLPLTPEWLVEVDGAKLLTDLFVDLSAAKEQYQKTKHSVELTRWLLDYDPQHVAELRSYVFNLLPPDT